MESTMILQVGFFVYEYFIEVILFFNIWKKILQNIL